MMGFVWVGMLVLSVFAALLEGRLGVLTSAAMEGASAAVTLCLSLAGALCLWSGVAKVMERAGLTEKLGKLMRPLFRRLFVVGGIVPLGVEVMSVKRCTSRLHSRLFAASRAFTRAALCASLTTRGGMIFTHALGMM